jgi:phosphoribosylamine--glycine ligase
MKALNSDGRTFRGVLYFELMITPGGAKVIEYNARFGDPEAQCVLPLVKTDMLEIMRAVSEGRLSEIKVEFTGECSCCVVAASGGYPEEYDTGYAIDGIEAASNSGAQVFHAGTQSSDGGRVLTSGGRVLGVTATAKTLAEAIKTAYSAIERIDFPGIHYRTDIGKSVVDW